MKRKWACPECGAGASGKHGQGVPIGTRRGGAICDCEGFLCECKPTGGNGHGETQGNPCPKANCDHCGWGGTFPPPRQRRR